jgi:hypothetical protein
MLGTLVKHHLSIARRPRRQGGSNRASGFSAACPAAATELSEARSRNRERASFLNPKGGCHNFSLMWDWRTYDSVHLKSSLRPSRDERRAYSRALIPPPEVAEAQWWGGIMRAADADRDKRGRFVRRPSTAEAIPPWWMAL